MKTNSIMRVSAKAFVEVWSLPIRINVFLNQIGDLVIN